MSREYQDYEFEVTDASNRVVTQLVGTVYDDDANNSPCVMFMRFSGPSGWQRFFLQAQIAFWETWDDVTINEELADCPDDGGRVVDFAQLIGGLPRVLSHAKAIKERDGLTQLHLVFDNDASCLLINDSDDLDSGFHVKIITPENAG